MGICFYARAFNLRNPGVSTSAADRLATKPISMEAAGRNWASADRNDERSGPWLERPGGWPAPGGQDVWFSRLARFANGTVAHNEFFFIS